jgi:stearoyl-CoA desaturase (delta-9 desaturase)
MDNAPTWRDEHAPYNPITTFIFTLTPLVALTIVPWYGIVHGYSVAAWVFFGLFLAFTGVAITGGYHRMWAHRAYSAHWSVRLFYMLFGTMALQQTILIWASQHRVHHQSVDDIDVDPYSAKRGFWFSHIGWILRNYPSGEVDFSNVRDLQRDPIAAFQHRFYIPLTLAMNIGLPLALGAIFHDLWGVFLLAGVLRLVINHHVTFFINSLAHMWGTQPYTDENTARDNHLLAFITYGEGYHNFHHIFANDYRNGVKWWQWDPTKWVIAGLSGLGLATNLKRVPDLWIHRAQLNMQFKRMERALEAQQGRHPREHLERLKSHVAEEYSSFKRALEEWTKVREEWVSDRKRRLLQRWEDASFRTRLREIEYRLRMQRRRLHLMAKTYA